VPHRRRLRLPALRLRPAAAGGGLRIIASHGGTLVYLRQHEGRGIGLVNKLRAYALQDAGLDTLDANLELGLPADARDYRQAARILEGLGIATLHLVTNNPAKAEALDSGRG
jgi:GTP cyclohydrolase II